MHRKKEKAFVKIQQCLKEAIIRNQKKRLGHRMPYVVTVTNVFTQGKMLERKIK